MKKTLLLLALAALAAAPVSAQDWAVAKLDKSPRHGEFVKIPQGARQVESYVVYPAAKDKVTAVVMIHEIFGLSDWARLAADEMAQAGYIAIAPDLLTGLGPNGGGSKELGLQGSTRVIGSLPPDQITADLNAVVDYVSKLPSCNGKVVVMGFCWGGGQTFRFATNNKNIKAALSFYGPIPTDAAALARINCPVYGFYGEMDARITASVPNAVDMMKGAGKTYEPVTYKGANHGFMRLGDGDPTGKPADIQTREDSWKRVIEILKKI